MAGFLAAGLLLALLLVVAPFVPATEDGATGAIVVGFGLGWVLLAVLSALFTDQPQRWAWVPSRTMNREICVSGLLARPG